MKNKKWICGLCALFLLFSSTSVLAAQVTFDGNHTYKANFKKKPYQLKISDLQYDSVNTYNQINVIDNMGEDTQKTQDFTEAHPGNTSLHGEYTVNGASGLGELYVKDNDRITIEFKADEDYFLKDVIYNGKSMLGSMQETYASDGSSQGSVSFNINNASAVQTLEVQFSPEWAYSTALSGGNIVLSRYVGRNTVVNVPKTWDYYTSASNKVTMPVLLNKSDMGSGIGPFGENREIEIINYPVGGVQCLEHNYGFLYADCVSLRQINNMIYDNAAVSYFGTFARCSSLSEIPSLGGGAALVNIAYMCDGASKITQYPYIGGSQAAPAGVTRIDMAFNNCKSISGTYRVNNTQIDIQKAKNSFATHSSGYTNVICSGNTYNLLAFYKSTTSGWENVALNGARSAMLMIDEKENDSIKEKSESVTVESTEEIIPEDTEQSEDTEETETIEETEVAENTETVEEGTEIEK